MTTTNDERLAWYRRMVEIRLFEEKVQELFMEGLIQGTTHLCQGQEAVSVGAVGALEERDYMTITYRGHGHALARGMSMVAAFGELMGRTSGCCNGVGGSMHLTDFSKNLIGAFAIIGAGLPVAVGAGLSAKMRGSDAVAISFSGDGGSNIGTFHEALNMAATWKVPVVFVIENNLYAEYSPVRETTPLDDLAERAKSYAMPGVIVDGQDVDAVYDVVSTAVARARAGEGPTLIEAKTYRYRGHSRTDPAKYRVEGELERWKERDPIDILAGRLGLSEEQQEEQLADAQAAVDAAAEEAEQAPIPTFEEIEKYVYAA
jgi:pyruvate dehydrogenase E1 component alpha subunit